MALEVPSTIGKLIEPGQQRDAIHIAIAPVVANMRLDPGDDVGFVHPDNTELVSKGDGIRTIGVIDPFLQDTVKPGERCWMFLYPNTITSLRHDWSHLAFGQGISKPTESEDKAYSERWLRDYAARVSHYDTPDVAYRELLSNAQRNHIFYHGSDLCGYSDLEQPKELFRHLEVVLGRKLDRHAFTYSCSC